MNNNDLNLITKGIAGYIFRNGIVEDMHAAGCLTDSQIKELTIYMVDRLGYCIHLISENKYTDFNILIGSHVITCKHWNDINFLVGEEDLRQIKKALDI